MKNKILAMLVAFGLVGSVSAIEINENLSINGFIDGSITKTDSETVENRGEHIPARTISAKQIYVPSEILRTRRQSAVHNIDSCQIIRVCRRYERRENGDEHDCSEYQQRYNSQRTFRIISPEFTPSG